MAAFFAWHRKNKIPRNIFLDFILFFNISVEYFGKKIIWSSVSSQKRFFLAQNIRILGPNFRNSVNKFLIIFMLLDNLKYLFLTYVNQKYQT